MRSLSVALVLVLVVGLLILGAATATADDGKLVRALDDCDPTDTTFPGIGCRRARGDVTNAEFNALVRSPLSLSTVGHPSWRFDPSYLAIGPKRTVKVRNGGGRPHTFTEVKAFGGGRVPPLNVGLEQAKECLLAPAAVDPTELQPGKSLRVTGLGAGDHLFQCCFHPWMRALIKVKQKD
ncbi:MAG: cupredoxin domain-containing protein [bacterium]